jgi:arylformamidase
MDQKELDDAYDQRVYAANMRQVLARTHRNSELVRERLGAPKRLAYGPTAIEALDLYPTKAADAPINVFIHGGAWRTEVAKDNAAQAEMLVNAGAHLAVLDFNNVIETGGDLMVMADQVRRGVAWIYKNARSFGGDPERFYISGHSSGGHWVGVLLTTDWRKDFGLPPTMIKGGVAGSGMFDLKPVQLGKPVQPIRPRGVRADEPSFGVKTKLEPLSALGPKRTHAVQQRMSAIGQKRIRSALLPSRHHNTVGADTGPGF